MLGVHIDFNDSVVTIEGNHVMVWDVMIIIVIAGIQVLKSVCESS